MSEEVIAFEYEKLPFPSELKKQLDLYMDQLLNANQVVDGFRNEVMATMVMVERIFSEYANKYLLNHLEVCSILYSFIDTVIGQIIYFCSKQLDSSETKSLLKEVSEHFKSSIINQLHRPDIVEKHRKLRERIANDS